MSRRRRQDEQPGPSGFLVVDKQRGATSHDMVDAARRWLGTRRVGHLGTLDPLATGVLPLAVRGATKLASYVDGTKTYWSRIRLGDWVGVGAAIGCLLLTKPQQAMWLPFLVAGALWRFARAPAPASTAGRRAAAPASSRRRSPCRAQYATRRGSGANCDRGRRRARIRARCT